MKTTRRPTQGSAFVSVLVVTTVLAIALVSILKWSGNERAMTVRNTRWLEARNAAEALAEYGFAQVRNQFNSKASPASFDPLGANPLALPPTTFWQNSNVDYAHTELLAGNAAVVPSSGGLYYIDPNNLNNQFDPLKGQWVYRRDVQVLAKATVSTTGGGPPISTYVTESVSVRGAPLFANAIFYGNNDLEIFPGPTMDVYGPVHCNGNIFVSSQGSTLSFHGPVSCSGNIYHAWSSSVSSAEGSGGETLGQSAVNFTNNLGQLVNMNTTGTSAGWKDSTEGADNGVTGLAALQALVTPAVSAQFGKDAAQMWRGNLQTSSMGIQAYNPISYALPIGVDGSGNPVYPDPHCIIDPPSPPPSADPYLAGKTEVEKEKFSMQTGLYIQAVVTSGAAGVNASCPTIRLFGPPGSAAAAGITDATDPTYTQHWKNGGVLLTNPVSMAGANPLVKFTPYKATTQTAGARGTGGADSTHYPITTLTSTSGGASSVVTYATTNTTAAGTVNTGMYDQRRATSSDPTYTKGAVDLVEIDMSVLRAAVNTMVSGTITNDSIKNPNGTLWTGWNGGVYVEVKAVNSAGADITGTTAQSASVRVINGTTASGTSMIPSYGSNGNGITIATNAPLYIKGNFNADGTYVAGTNGSSVMPDDGHTGSATDHSAESPACLAADAISILSPGWSDANSLTINNSASGNVEVASAFLSGLVSTDATGASTNASSGGAHNLPRFLESWSGKTVAIRGSLCCLYLSKVATQPWATRYYGAPARAWGFDSLFANGAFPPLTPKVVSYRRVAFQDLSAADYAAAKHRLWPSNYP